MSELPVVTTFQERLNVALERYRELALGDGLFGINGRVGLKSIDEFSRGVRNLTSELERVPVELRDQVRDCCVPCFDAGLMLFEVHQAGLLLLKGLKR